MGAHGGVGRHRGRRRRGPGAILLALVVATVVAGTVASGPGAHGATPAAGAPSPSVLVPGGTVPYRFTPGASGRLTVSNPATVPSDGAQARWVWSPPGTASGPTESACDTWDSQTGTITQQGVALRVVAGGGTVRSAITVTKNVYANTVWVFNVHLWTGSDYHLIGQYVLKHDLLDGHRLDPLPWRMCAEATGATLRFVVWPLSRREPAWGDPDDGATLTLPAGWEYADGRPGFYVGHLHGGDRATFSDPRVTAGP